MERSFPYRAPRVRAGRVCSVARRSWRRSPAETYRLHHNIKASEYRVIGKPESKLSPQANAAGEWAGCGGKAGGAGSAGMARRVVLRAGGFARGNRAVRVKIAQ